MYPCPKRLQSEPFTGDPSFPRPSKEHYTTLFPNSRTDWTKIGTSQEWSSFRFANPVSSYTIWFHQINVSIKHPKRLCFGIGHRHLQVTFPMVEGLWFNRPPWKHSVDNDYNRTPWRCLLLSPLQYLATLLEKLYHCLQTSLSFIRWGCQNILPASKATNGGGKVVAAQMYPWEACGSPRAHKSHALGREHTLMFVWARQVPWLCRSFSSSSNGYVLVATSPA